MIVQAFRGLRPRADLAGKIPSLPYDVLDSDEARRTASGDPYTFLHVVKAEIDLDPSVPLHDGRVYAKARENFTALRERGWMLRDRLRAYYVYSLTMDGRTQTGIVGVAAAADYLEGRIKRHEHTRPEKEDDRLHHAAALNANPGPIFLAHRGSTALEGICESTCGAPADAAFTSPGGVEHALWVVDDPETVTAIEEGFAALPATYIADGHHRAAAYTRLASRKKAEAGASWTGREPFNFVLAVHFPAKQLRILDYNRLVRDLNGLDVAGLVARIRAAGFDVHEGYTRRRPVEPGSFGMFAGGGWSLLSSRAGTAGPGDPVARLDVSVLADRILGPILGVGDARTDPRIDFVGGIRGMEELERRVRSGEHSVAFSMVPTPMDAVMDVADAGLVMPPKSTWFEPKLRSGLVVHLLEGETL